MTLQAAATKTAKCSVTSEGWMFITVTTEGNTWEGRVEFFERSRPPPKYVYGWTVESPGKEPLHVTFLQSELIKSAPDAVSAWMARLARD